MSQSFHNNMILCLMGPTASGKTGLAMQLSEKLPVALINVDSAQVYRDLNIGSGKPDKITLQKYPHALMDIVEPFVPYSAYQFCEDVQVAIDEAFAMGRLPVLVGGTMLYFKALLEGMAILPSADPKLRAALEEEGQLLGWPVMHARLASVDPIAAARIKPTDPQRIQRALEVFYTSGKTLTACHAAQEKTALPYETLCVGLCPKEGERHLLHAKIEARFHQMIEQGLVEEVRTFMGHPQFNPDLPAFRAVGYRQVIQYLNGEFDYSAMIEKAVAATRQLAKRQLTWLRGWPNLIELDCNQNDMLETILTLIRTKV